MNESLSDLTFSLLSSNDNEFPGDGSSTSITVQNFDKKCSELHVLLQFLFMKCFTGQSPSTKWLAQEHDFTVACRVIFY